MRISVNLAVHAARGSPLRFCILVSAFCLLTAVGLGSDVGIDTIARPNGTIDSGEAVVPTCVVHAYTGSGPVDVHFLIPEAGYHDSLTLLPLPPGMIDSVKFTPWTPIGRDSMTALAWLYCAGDTNPQNDTFRMRFRVLAAELALEITVPRNGDTLDSGAVFFPQCRIWNLSGHSLMVEVRFTIGVYRVTRVFNLGAGGATVVTAPAPYAAMPGAHLLVVEASTGGRVYADTSWFYVRGGAGVEEGMKDEGGRMNSGPTILSAYSVKRLASGVLFDALGRRVLHPKPGVCFLRERLAVNREPSAVIKVVIEK